MKLGRTNSASTAATHARGRTLLTTFLGLAIMFGSVASLGCDGEGSGLAQVARLIASSQEVAPEVIQQARIKPNPTRDQRRLRTTHAAEDDKPM
jgi:hypothetical protein